jgi:hypothetical protein
MLLSVIRPNAVSGKVDFDLIILIQRMLLRVMKSSDLILQVTLRRCRVFDAILTCIRAWMERKSVKSANSGSSISPNKTIFPVVSPAAAPGIDDDDFKSKSKVDPKEVEFEIYYNYLEMLHFAMDLNSESGKVFGQSDGLVIMQQMLIRVQKFWEPLTPEQLANLFNGSYDPALPAATSSSVAASALFSSVSLLNHQNDGSLPKPHRFLQSIIRIWRHMIGFNDESLVFLFKTLIHHSMYVDI